MDLLCIVIPCYNEEQRFDRAQFRAYVASHPAVHFLLVDDGSRDGTAAMLDALAAEFPDRVAAHRLQPNGGKAEAVRRGALQALAWKDFAYIGYFDADFATPLDQIDYFYEFNRGTLTRAVMLGCRFQHLGARIRRKPHRHYLGRVFATVVSVMLDLPVYDTQCGAKLLSAEVVRQVFQAPFRSKWFFDVEMLARVIRHFGYDFVDAQVQEIPLRTWIEKGDSRLKATDFLRVPLDLWRIARANPLPKRPRRVAAG